MNSNGRAAPSAVLRVTKAPVVPGAPHVVHTATADVVTVVETHTPPAAAAAPPAPVLHGHGHVPVEAPPPVDRVAALEARVAALEAAAKKP